MIRLQGIDRTANRCVPKQLVGRTESRWSGVIKRQPGLLPGSQRQQERSVLPASRQTSFRR